MNHLDEGTIHAWLDGALDAAQVAEVEGHVATCASCAEAVAEARGLMAAASRIMRALDDDRANVIPRPAAIPGVTPLQPTKRPMRRTVPWIGAVAALLIAAVVLRTADISKGLVESESVTLRSEAAAPVMDSARAASPPPALPSAPAPRPTVAEGAASTRRQAGRIAGAAGNAGSVGVGSSERRTVAAVPEPVAAATGVEAQRLQDSGSVLQTRVAKAAADQSTALRGVLATAEMTPTERLVGCYRLDPRSVVASAEASMSAPAGVDAATANRARLRRGASVAAPAAARADFADARAPSLIRLDTTRAALGLAVVGLPSDSAIGAWRIVRDSARVDLGTRGMVMLGVTQKVPCPEP
jgi:anti-sigma factor RsiW